MTKIALQIQLQNYKEQEPIPSLPTIVVNRTEIDFGSVPVGEFSLPQTINVVGYNLTEDVVVNAPEGFIINDDDSDTNMSPMVLVPVSGSVSKTIYVKANPLLEQNYSTVINITSSGAISKTVSVSADGVEASPFITFGTDGTVTQEGDYKIVEFTDTENPGQIDFTFVPDDAEDVYVEVVGGGAGGGGGRGNGAATGAGAAGQWKSFLFKPIAMPYAAFVGKKGLGGLGSNQFGVPENGTNGGDSYFNGITSVGGGYGGFKPDVGGGGDGGNGGGASSSNADLPGGIGIDNDGGAARAAGEPYRGGGGGSTAEAGGDGAVNGKGGDGTLSLITGQKEAGGGGGGSIDVRPIGLGSDGGGDGGNTGDGQNATTPGSGGGGGGNPSNGATIGGKGGDGADGIIRIKIYSPA